MYDSQSSFSNQDESGIIIFGVDEKQDYKEVGVYDPQDCLQMEPIVRPLLTVVEKDGKSFVSAEIPGVDLANLDDKSIYELMSVTKKVFIGGQRGYQ